MNPDFALDYIKPVSDLTFLFVYNQNPYLKSRSESVLIKQGLSAEIYYAISIY